MKILREEGFEVDGGRTNGGKSGVVHSFTGTIEEAKELVSRSLKFDCDIPILTIITGGNGILHWFEWLLAQNGQQSVHSQVHSSRSYHARDR